ncbi:DUF2254 domain-containing protein [Salinicoccus roseus]|uniref:DUF2254 domain-containing protein n=1 Tax=Salinicoccus roseus TaxID=45670 RepID=UPI000FBB3F9B|nr:DUF2254 domain-containing protein [Salinicoccus roseus]RPE50935.1 putative membrane protein [Salinicoccus roseus]GGA79318.1 hypothetical protein GCM10007176_24540 [Salinicoccus roseus]
MKFLKTIRNSIWVIPVIYCLMALALALIVVYIDMKILPLLNFELAFFLATSVDLAKEILGSISGALLTMTTITFSTIMVVLTTYSSQFSPRVLTNFVNDRRTMRVLGVFMGGFLYSILSLAFMQQATFEGEVISAIVAVMLAVLCLFFFAYFIHFVASSIQVSNLINSLVEDVKDEIEKEEKRIDQDHVAVSGLKPEVVESYDATTALQSEDFGFIQFMNHDRLFEWAEENGAVIHVEQLVGEFVTTSTILITIHHDEGTEIPDSLIRNIELGKERSVYQDVDYGLQKIVDVAIRALSPGINDPNTAVQCIHYLSEALIKNFKYTGTYVIYNDEKHLGRLVVRRSSVEDKLYKMLSQISFYGRQDVTILRTLIEALENIALNSTDDVKRDIEAFSRYVYDGFDEGVLYDIDYKYINERQVRLSEALNRAE